jgi:protein-S-isoprenylcysteine O-methyltransferase Ste14
LTAEIDARGQRWQKIARRIRVPAGFVFAVIYLWAAPRTISRASILWSIALVLPGLALRAYAAGYVKKNAELTITGPYAHTRNPLYLGSVLMAAGFGVASMNVWLVAGLVIFYLAIYLPVIRGEEVYLRAHFANFDDYAAHVPRLLPRIMPYRATTGTAASVADPAQPRFSFARYRHHREYNSLMGALGMYALLTLILHLLH